MTHILLARHGETEWNASGRVQGHSDSLLSACGVQQAAALAARLASVPLHAVYASDLSRALETAKAVAGPRGLPVQTDPALREKGFGAWEGLTATEIKAQWPDAWPRALHTLDEAPPGGEAWPAVAERMLQALRRILEAHSDADETVLLVGHGGSLRTLLLHALDAPLSALRRLHLDNASLSRIDFPPDRPPRLLLLNDTSHLDGLP